MTRFCPFCGQANEEAYTFCLRCGKPIPAIPSSPSVPFTSPPISPPPPPEWTGLSGGLSPAIGEPPAASPEQAPSGDDDVSFERPLTDGERDLLRKVQRGPRVAIGRVFGTLLGIVPLFLVLLSFAGESFVALNASIILLVAPFLGVGLAAASFANRVGATTALSRGVAREVRGVPGARKDVPPAMTEVELGEMTFRLKRSLASEIHDGRLNALTLVAAGIPGAKSRRPGLTRNWVIGVNGRTVDRVSTSYLVSSQGTSATVAGR